MKRARAEVVEIRKEEARNALSILGVAAAETFCLDQADGELSDLMPMRREEVVAALVARLEELQPGEVCVPHRTDNHPDHRAAYTLTREALALWGQPVTLLEYPVWLFWWRNIPSLDLKPHELAGARRLPLAASCAKKQAAVLAYASQAAILPPGFLDLKLTPFWHGLLRHRQPGRPRLEVFVA